MVMRYNDDFLKTVPSVASAFNVYFSSKINHAKNPAIIYESYDLAKFDDILRSLKPSIIREMILNMEKSPTITNDFLPPKVLKLFPDVFAIFLLPVFCSIILTISYPDIWKSPFYDQFLDLLPKCWLLFENFVYRHIYSHVWTKIHPKQFASSQERIVSYSY